MCRNRKTSSSVSCGPDQLLADERRQASSRRSLPVGSDCGERIPLELQPDERRALEHLALVVRQLVETRGEQRVDRRRQLRGLTAFRECRQELLDEQRIALGGPPDLGAGLLLHLPAGDESADQLVGLGVGQRLQRDGAVRLAGAPARSRVEQLGPRETEEQDRRVARPVDEVLEQVEERRLRPVDVVDDSASGRSRARCSNALRTDQKIVLRRGRREGGAKLDLRAGRAEDLDERPVRDALAVREAAPREDRRLTPPAPRELVGEP